MARVIRLAVAMVVAAALLGAAREARGYSVLAHESNVDALWAAEIRPLLARRFPRASAADLAAARAYAYGGSVIQDLGYYPFGSHFFSNLLHYVRSGDFVETMLRDARDLNEYAFALGALAHYAADNTGHPEAVNRAVAMMFPKLRAKYGNTITYVKSPATHVLVEFSFDVVQAAAGSYAPDAYHAFIGFEVAKPLLERAFRETYGLDMDDAFLFDEDLAIGSYRHAISQTIPEITRIAWRDKREEIEKLMPGVGQDRFVFTLTRQQYESAYGTGYKRPGFFARVLAFLYRLLPKIGPLRPLKFEAPTPAAEKLFVASLRETRDRYRTWLESLRDGRVELPNTDFDTGRPSVHGEYELADETYADLLARHADQHFERMTPALRRNVLAYYDAAPDKLSSPKEAKRMKKVRRQLAALRESAALPARPVPSR
jgi:hypothetical protein